MTLKKLLFIPFFAGSFALATLSVPGGGGGGGGGTSGGVIVQSLSTMLHLVETSSVAIPVTNDNAPQIDKGKQILSKAITFKSLANEYKVYVIVPAVVGAPKDVTVAVFEAGINDTIGWNRVTIPSADYAQVIAVNAVQPVTTLSPTTISVRVGTSDGTQVTINGYTGGNQLGGGKGGASLFVEEIDPTGSSGGGGISDLTSFTTDDLSQGSTNKYFSNSLAQAACVAQTITNGTTTSAPSQDAVFDALALKADLSALGLKAPLASPTFTGTVSGVTKAHVGLGNVDNTADASKTFAASQITSGVLSISRLATGTPDGTKFVADDGTLKTPSGGGGGGGSAAGTDGALQANSSGSFGPVAAFWDSVAHIIRMDSGAGTDSGIVFQSGTDSGTTANDGLYVGTYFGTDGIIHNREGGVYIKSETAAASSFTAAGVTLNSSGYDNQITVQNSGIVLTAGVGQITTNGRLSASKGIRLVLNGDTKPTCAAGERGTVWFTQGGTGVGDVYEVCMKNSSDAYAWVTK